RHWEAGASYRSTRQGHLSLAAFQDYTHDKIVFVPSLINAMKATNLRATQIRGLEAEILLHLSSLPTDLGAGVSKLEAIDRSTSGKETAVPFVPEMIANVFLTYRTALGTGRVSARHRGEAHADVLNKNPLPTVTTWDASWDYNHKRFACGLHIHNVTDVKSAAFEVPGTGEPGRRAYSELSGYPLPGRTWETSCSTTF